MSSKQPFLYIYSLKTIIINKTNMKNLTKLFLGLLLSAVVFTGCKEAEELADVKFPANYETEIDVTVVPSTSAKVTNGTFSVSETIDPTSDSDFSKYLDKIKGITVNEVSGLILSVEPNITLTSTVITVSNANHIATWEFSNLPITVGTELTLDNNDGQWDAIEQILLDKEIFNVSISGQANEENAEFVVLVKINSVVLANPISN